MGGIPAGCCKGKRIAVFSIHGRKQGSFTSTSVIIEGPTEDYFDREQPDDPDRGYSSTEFATYNGLSSAQARDYLLFRIDPFGGAVPAAFSLETIEYGGATHLLFGHIYRYRLRNVFVGSVSLDATDSRLARLPAAYERSFPFSERERSAQVKSSRFTTEEDKGPNAGGRTIYPFRGPAASPNYARTVSIDVDTSRYHGLLLANTSEPERYRNRKHVSDLGKFFWKDAGNSTIFLILTLAGSSYKQRCSMVARSRKKTSLFIRTERIVKSHGISFLNH